MLMTFRKLLQGLCPGTSYTFPEALSTVHLTFALPVSAATTGTMAYSMYADVMSWQNLRAFLLYQFGILQEATNPYTGAPGVWDTESDAVATY